MCLTPGSGPGTRQALSPVPFAFSFTHCHSLCSHELSQPPLSCFLAQNRGHRSPPAQFGSVPAAPAVLVSFFLAAEPSALMKSFMGTQLNGGWASMDTHTHVRMHTAAQPSCLPGGMRTSGVRPASRGRTWNRTRQPGPSGASAPTHTCGSSFPSRTSGSSSPAGLGRGLEKFWGQQGCSGLHFFPQTHGHPLEGPRPHPTRPTPSAAGTSAVAHTTAAGAGWWAGRPAGRCCPCKGSALQERRTVGPGLGLRPGPSLVPSSPALTHTTLQAAFGVRNLGGQGKAPVGGQSGPASWVPSVGEAPPEP